MTLDQSTYDLIDRILFSVELEEGRAPEFVVVGGVSHGTAVRSVKRPRPLYAKWSPEEDQYLRENLGWKTEEEMAEDLGRTANSVHLRWKRDLRLPAPSRQPDFITAHQASQLIGLDNHKIVHWCDVGLIPSRILPGDRHIRVIHRTTFDRWVVSPSNWIYFDWKKIPDPRLRRLCERRAERWGDEWWSTVQVAQYHGVSSKDVIRLITIVKKLPAVQVATSLGGRHKDPRWLNWFVKRSDALKIAFLRGRGSGHKKVFSPRAEAWMVKAYKNGVSLQGIERSMGRKYDAQTIKKNIVRLLDKEQKVIIS